MNGPGFVGTQNAQNEAILSVRFWPQGAMRPKADRWRLWNSGSSYGVRATSPGFENLRHAQRHSMMGWAGPG